MYYKHCQSIRDEIAMQSPPTSPANCKHLSIIKKDSFAFIFYKTVTIIVGTISESVLDPSADFFSNIKSQKVVLCCPKDGGIGGKPSGKRFLSENSLNEFRVPGDALKSPNSLSFFRCFARNLPYCFARGMGLQYVKIVALAIQILLNRSRLCHGSSFSCFKHKTVLKTLFCSAAAVTYA